MNSKSGFNLLDSWIKIKTLDLDLITSLMNTIEEAAFLIDIENRKLVSVNRSFEKCTGYSNKDLQTFDLSTLFSGLPDELSISDYFECKLTYKNALQIDVIVNSFHIVHEKKWQLWKIQPVEESSNQTKGWWGNVFGSLDELTRLFEIENLETALDQAAHITASLMNLRSVAIYRALPDTPKLSRVAYSGQENSFPGYLPSTDLIQLNEPNLWTQGKRVATEIHRSGKVMNYSLVASYPLGQGAATWGLLVVGDPDRLPDVNLLTSLKPIASQISAVYQHLILVENLRSQIEKDRNGLAVQDAIIENLKEGVIILTPKLTIAGMNQAVEWTLGYANSEVRGMPVENIVIGSERLIQALEIATKGYPTHNLGMASLHRRNGQSFPSRLQVVPVMNQNDILAIVLFIEDCSEDEQIRARSEQLEHRAVLGEVTAVFAHEVRNPINNISTGLQLLATQLPADDDGQDAIQKMLNDCTRLNHLMESVLSFSRPNELKLEVVDLVEFLRRFMGKWQPRFARVNILPHFQNTKSPINIFGDPRALEQVFTNLVSNAIDVMSKLGGTLAIHLEQGNSNAGVSEVVISVSDNGPGIPEELCEKIFEPFVTSNPRGTGLGLAITKRIITAHKGSIQVNSFPGGTVFVIRLPAYLGDNS